MSYRRAWLLVDSLNQSFREPLVETQTGGSRGGGAGLTDLGQQVVGWYRTIEKTLAASAANELRALTSRLADRPPSVRDI